MDKFKNKYRIASHRMPDWDYSGNGYYFITMVTQNRECNMGKIVKTNDGASLLLSDFGEIIKNEWCKSFDIRKELFLDEFIMMPNHLHAIIKLEKPENDNLDGLVVSPASHVETHGRASLQQTEQQSINQPKKSPFFRKPKSISSFIGGFKSAINSKIDDFIDHNNLNIPKYNRNNHFFQANYYDHIIRNHIEYRKIKNYIINNPSKWENDKFNPSKPHLE
jgi:putative transposase